MWFKNLIIYRLPVPWAIDLAKLEEQLARNPFAPAPAVSSNEVADLRLDYVGENRHERRNQ